MITRTMLFAGLLMAGINAEASTLSIAQKYIGLHERANRAALRKIMGFDPRSAWCGAFATAVVRKAGRKPPAGHNMARSWLRFGKAVRLAQARAGDVVVLGRHVGILHSRRAGKVCLVSGNSANRVRMSCYPASKVKGVRR